MASRTAPSTRIPEGACPQTVSDFDDYVTQTIERDLRSTSVARIVAYAGRHPPMPWPIGPLAGILTTFVTAGMLPAYLRSGLGYRWSPSRQRLLRVFFLALRVLARLTPRPVRHAPNRWLIGRKEPLGLWRGRAVRLPAGLGG